MRKLSVIMLLSVLSMLFVGLSNYSYSAPKFKISFETSINWACFWLGKGCIVDIEFETGPSSGPGVGDFDNPVPPGGLAIWAKYATAPSTYPADGESGTFEGGSFVPGGPGVIILDVPITIPEQECKWVESAQAFAIYYFED